MRISIRQYLGKNHSWAVVGQNLARYFHLSGHDVSLCSTNGYEYFPQDLEPLVACKYCADFENKQLDLKFCGIKSAYDMQISYTAMKNWEAYLSNGSKNRFAIWNYDGSYFPRGWTKFYKNCDLVLPSSQFSKDTFIRNGVPSDVLQVVPHGISDEFLQPSDSTYHIDTDRKYKFLINIAQAHTRKNIPGLFDAWGKAFTSKDDVVLIAKVASKKPDVKKPFEVDWIDKLIDMKKKYRHHAPVIVVNDFIPHISDLYRSCTIGLSAAHVECFNLPALEMMSLGKITIASGYGGNVDFMNADNSLLINGRVGRAPPQYQYWSPNIKGEMFYPDTNHLVELMQLSVSKHDELVAKFAPNLLKIREQYSWSNIVNQILSLAR